MNQLIPADKYTLAELRVRVLVAAHACYYKQHNYFLIFSGLAEKDIGESAIKRWVVAAQKEGDLDEGYLLTDSGMTKVESSLEELPNSRAELVTQVRVLLERVA
jgi:hypothetical protein